MTYDIRKIVSSNIFVVNSSYFPLLYIRCTKFVRWNCLMKLAPGVFWREIKYLITSVRYQLASTKSPVQTKTWVTNPDNIPLKMSGNSSTTITVHSFNSFEKSLSLLSISSNEIGPGSWVGRVSTSKNGRTPGRPWAATYQSRLNGTSCSSLGTQTYVAELRLINPVSGYWLWSGIMAWYFSEAVL